MPRRLSALDDIGSVQVLIFGLVANVTESTLVVQQPIAVGDHDWDDVLLAGALACKKPIGTSDSSDAVEIAIHRALSLNTEVDRAYASYSTLEHEPYDPILKSAGSTCRNEDGTIATAMWGAPMFILNAVMGKTEVPAQTQDAYKTAVAECAVQGYRTLGIMRKINNGPWELLGLIPLASPIRPEAPLLLQQTQALGLSVKITGGDSSKIFSNKAKELGLPMEVVTQEAFGLDKVGPMTVEDNKVS